MFAFTILTGAPSWLVYISWIQDRVTSIQHIHFMHIPNQNNKNVIQVERFNGNVYNLIHKHTLSQLKSFLVYEGCCRLYPCLKHSFALNVNEVKNNGRKLRTPNVYNSFDPMFDYNLMKIIYRSIKVCIVFRVSERYFPINPTEPPLLLW